jgi:hypothetical protein
MLPFTRLYFLFVFPEAINQLPERDGFIFLKALFVHVSKVIGHIRLHLVDVLHLQAAVEPHISVILKNGIVDRFHDAGTLGRVGQMDVVAAHFLAQKKPPLFLDALIPQFLPPRLDGEISLSLCHNLLLGVGVLNSQIAGVARQENGFDWPLRAASYGDHFGDVNEMVIEAVSAVETGHLSLFNNPLEIAVIAVADHRGKIAA